MKISSLVYFGCFVLVIAGVLVASQTDDRPRTPSRLDFTDKAAGFAGRKLEPEESTSVSDAITAIGTPPPASITFPDTNGVNRTVSCADLANLLRTQLNGGHIQVETLNTGVHGVTQNNSQPGTQDDEMNISDEMLGFGEPIDLQETLVHEAIHKNQTTHDRDAGEMEAHGAELAYKDSCNVSSDSPFYKDAKLKFLIHQASWELGNIFDRLWNIQGFSWGCSFIQFDTTGSGVDYLTTFPWDGSDWNEFSLFPTRGSDMIVFEEHFMLPPGHSFALICGGEPGLGVGRLAGYELDGTEFMGQLLQYDFGPPQGLDPMFFYSMTRRMETDTTFYMLDTLGKRIYKMEDTFLEDHIPDEIVSTYADALWPGFEPLLDARGVDAADHPDLGFGIVLSHDGVHLPDHTFAHEERFFLPDSDGNDTADACFPIPRYEFLSFKPVIDEPLPWPGHETVQLYASWNHMIEVWSTDSVGQTLYEHLGTTIMTGGVNGECLLNRPLNEGEFVLPVDLSNGTQPYLATKIEALVPEELTIRLMEDGQLKLEWEAIPGIETYKVWGSIDSEIFEDEVATVTFENTVLVSMPPGVDMYFYRVTAIW